MEVSSGSTSPSSRSRMKLAGTHAGYPFNAKRHRRIWCDGSLSRVKRGFAAESTSCLKLIALHVLEPGVGIAKRIKLFGLRESTNYLIWIQVSPRRLSKSRVHFLLPTVSPVFGLRSIELLKMALH